MTDGQRKPPLAGQLGFDWGGPASPVEPHPIPTPAEPHEEPVASQPTVVPADLEPDNPVELERPDRFAYGPRHPWHYYQEGDHAPPVPFDAIPPCESSGRALMVDLPKALGRRMVKVRELLDTERCELATAALRYQDLIDRGVDALSTYDRSIAYAGNDELARAATIALLYGQVAWRRGRISCLERESTRGGWLER